MSKFADFYSSPNNFDLSAQEDAYKILKEIDADFVAWWRKDDGRLFEVTFPVFRYGASLGGYSKGLAYVVDYRTSPPKSDGKDRFTQIAATPWFIEEFDTR